MGMGSSPTTFGPERSKTICAVRNALPTAPLLHTWPAFPPAVQQEVDNQRAPLTLNITQLEHELSAIHKGTEEATTELLESVGSVRKSKMPLCVRTSSSSSDELQVRCWGPQWSEICSELEESKLFAVPQVVLSLCSAYFLGLFNREWPTCVLDCDVRKLLETNARGRAVLSLLTEGKLLIRPLTPAL